MSNEKFWTAALLIGSGFAAAIASSRRKDSLLEDGSGSVITILKNGVIRDGKTPISLDQIANTTRLLSATILIPHDLEFFPDGNESLKRARELLLNKSIPFEVIRFFDFDGPDKDNIVVQAIDSPFSISLTDSDLILNSEHELSDGSLLGVQFKESSAPLVKQLLSGIEGGIFSSASEFYEFLTRNGILDVNVFFPAGNQALAEKLISSAPPFVGVVDENGIALTQNLSGVNILLDKLSIEKEALAEIDLEILSLLSGSSDSASLEQAEQEKEEFERRIREIDDEINSFFINIPVFSFRIRQA